jgi:Tfp pilus assembly protein PilN
MRELDFLPPWYRDLLRRRRTTLIHLSALGLLVVGVAGGTVHRHAQIRAAEQDLASATAELAGTRADLQKLDALRHLRDQWRRQEQVLTSTGVNVEPSRLLSVLAKIVPPDTALTGIAFSVAESDRTAASAVAVPTTAPFGGDAARTATPTPAGAAPSSSHPRRLNVTLRGVAPGELAVANVLAGISKTSLFKHVNLTYAKDREERDRLVREFEVTFVINLDPEVAEEGK